VSVLKVRQIAETNKQREGEKRIDAGDDGGDYRRFLKVSEGRKRIRQSKEVGRLRVFHWRGEVKTIIHKIC